MGLICKITGMEIKNIYQPFEIEYLQVKDYSVKEHKHTFFEMVFILEGKGIQSINKHTLPYKADKLFLIFPQDTHGFEVHKETKFLFIRFNDGFLKTQTRDLVQKLEFIFLNHNHLPGCVVHNRTDKPLIRALVEALIREHINQQPDRNDVIRHLINTLIAITARNITLMTPAIKNEKHTPSIDLLTYIHQNIYDPGQLKVEKIAAQLNISPTYVSEYFKTQTGENLQQYIINYKMRLIETRLQYTDMQVNEIVHELGFTDASHLNRLFKKYKGVSPSEFRKSVARA